MAEYYPLISRAVGGLADSTGEKRHALYERARFSHHEIDPAMRDDAIEALTAVRDELREAAE